MVHSRTFGVLALLWVAVLAGCGGGGGDADPGQPQAQQAPTATAAGNAGLDVGIGAVNTLPVATITSPAIGQTFKAGDVLTFTGSATDAEDGSLTASRLTWWAELHHDAHTHPFQAETVGASGTVTIPVRGETADNIFYRFHLRATDSSGSSVEVLRDVQPQKSQVSLLTDPPGLALTLDGQPVASGAAFTGVVGIERDLGAADQIANGRRYRFATWSDGGAATHVISTPVADTNYIATFTDIGPANNLPPAVSLSAPATAATGAILRLVATASDADGSVVKVEFYDGAVLIGDEFKAPYTLNWTATPARDHLLTARATDDQGATTTSTIRVVAVRNPSTADKQAPVALLTAPANYAADVTGVVNVTATASDNVGVTSVEFQVDGIRIGALDTTPPYSTSVNTAAYASGQHSVRVRARDAAGNLSAWSRARVKFTGGVPVTAGFTLQEDFVTGLLSATAMAAAPDGRLFLAEQTGRLRVVKNGVLLAQPFATVTLDKSGERGLIGVTLHPQFATNGYVYIYSTRSNAGVSNNRISRFTAQGDVALAGSEVTLVDLPALSSATNHNGGAMHFGIDGKLYVGVGENANPARAQDLSQPFGKLLRFNDDGSIPTDNPFYATQTGIARAIWAFGLRNPFTFAVQPGTGRIFINDVGQSTWEEINLGAPGANYGWPGSEGPDNISAGITAPLYTYKHSNADPAGSGPGGFITGYAIAGGTFYPASGAFPTPYRSQYYFADFVSRFVARLDPANGNGVYTFARLAGQPVDMAVGTDGAIYVLTRTGVTRIAAN